MKSLITILIIFTLAIAAEAQTPLAAPNTTRRMRSLFGALLIDNDLQKELRMTRVQLKRMQEIYLQYADPASVVFSSWGISNLAITDEQLKQFKQMKAENNHEKLQVLLDKSGKYKDGDKLKKIKEMDIATSRKSLTILTRSQLEKYERLKGKPYKLRMFAPPKSKTTSKPNANAVRRR